MWKGEGYVVLLCCRCVNQSEVPAVFRSESHNFYLVLTAPRRRSSVTAPFCLFTYDVDCWQVPFQSSVRGRHFLLDTKAAFSDTLVSENLYLL